MKRFVCATLVVSLLFGTAGCSTDSDVPKASAVYVSESDPWYSSRRLSVPAYPDVYHTNIDCIGCDGENIFVRLLGWDYDFETVKNEVVSYDMDGSLTASVDLMPLEKDESSYSSQSQFFVLGGDCYYLDSYTSYDTGETSLDLYSVSFESGSLEACPGNGLVSYLSSLSESYGAFMETSSGLVFAVGSYDSNYKFVIDRFAVVASDLSVTETPADELSDIAVSDCWIAGDSYVFVSSDITAGDGTFVDREDYVFSLSDGSLTPVEGYSGSGEVTRDGTTFYKFNPSTCRKESFFSITNCNFNLSDFWAGSMDVVYEDGNRIVFFENDISAGADSDIFECIYYCMDRCDTNPNAGKVLLSAATLSSYIDNEVCEAVYEFNNQSDSAFIAFDYSYVPSEDDEDGYGLTGTASRTQQLIADVLAGTGPDIVLGGMGQTEFDNSGAFLDLSSYVSDLSSSEYFTNVFECAKVDGKLYQCPVGVKIYCAMASSSDVTSSGFTFDEYAALTDEVFNGKQPVGISARETFLLGAIRSCYSQYVSSGKIDLDNENFRTLAAYCKDNLTDEGGGYTPDVNSMGWYDFESYIDFINDLGDSSVALYTYPSSDAASPALYGRFSIAISASCASPDEAGSFVEFCLSEDGQKIIGDTAVMKSVFENACAEDIEHAKTIQSMLESYGAGYDNPYTEPSQDEIAIFENCIENATEFARIDSDIAIIISEEIAAYYADQKSLDDVIKIINDRAQTVLDER